MKITYWTDFPAFTLTGVVCELAERPDVDLLVVCEGALPEERRQLGWTTATLGRAQVVRLAAASWQEQIKQIVGERRDSVHLLSGMGFIPRLNVAFAECWKAQALTGILSEPPVNQFYGWRYWAKVLYLHLLFRARSRRLARRTRFLLALTSPDDPTFAEMGWQRHQIYPFGYFVDSAACADGAAAPGSPLKCLCMGFLRRYKAFDVVIRAAGRLKSLGQNIRLDIYGIGPMQAAWEQQIRQEHLEDVVSLRPAVPHDQMPGLLRAADVLIVPGLVEPWGFAVNEGIEAGRAIIVSDGVRGGSALVRHGRCGEVVRAGDVGDLAAAIGRLAADPDLLAQYQQQSRRYRDLLAPRVAADYLHQIIAFETGALAQRPVAPWLAYNG